MEATVQNTTPPVEQAIRELRTIRGFALHCASTLDAAGLREAHHALLLSLTSLDDCLAALEHPGLFGDHRDGTSLVDPVEPPEQPTRVIPIEAASRRFAIVETDETNCWIWRGTRTPHGYGRIQIDGQKLVVHRLLYEELVGPVPEGLELDHLCRERACVNPGHLEPVTHRENLLRGETLPALNAAKTHCANGHPFTEANTYEWRGTRRCRICNTEAKRRQRLGRPDSIADDRNDDLSMDADRSEYR